MYLAFINNAAQQTFVFQDVFSVTLFFFKDVLKTSSRHLARRFQESSRRVCKTSCNMSSRRLGRQKNVTLKTSSVRLHQDECLLGDCPYRFSFDGHPSNSKFLFKLYDNCLYTSFSKLFLVKFIFCRMCL